MTEAHTRPGTRFVCHVPPHLYTFMRFVTVDNGVVLEGSHDLHDWHPIINVPLPSNG